MSLAVNENQCMLMHEEPLNCQRYILNVLRPICDKNENHAAATLYTSKRLYCEHWDHIDIQKLTSKCNQNRRTQILTLLRYENIEYKARQGTAPKIIIIALVNRLKNDVAVRLFRSMLLIAHANTHTFWNWVRVCALNLTFKIASTPICSHQFLFHYSTRTALFPTFSDCIFPSIYYLLKRKSHFSFSIFHSFCVIFFLLWIFFLALMHGVCRVVRLSSAPS